MNVTQQYRRAVRRWAKARKLFAHPRDGTIVRPNKLCHGWAAIHAAERAWEEARHVGECGDYECRPGVDGWQLKAGAR